MYICTYTITRGAPGLRLRPNIKYVKHYIHVYLYAYNTIHTTSVFVTRTYNYTRGSWPSTSIFPSIVMD